MMISLKFHNIFVDKTISRYRCILSKLASYELLTTQVARVKAEYPNQLDYMGYHEFGAK